VQFVKEIISLKAKILLITNYGGKKSNFSCFMLKLIITINEHINSKQHNPRQLWNSLKELSGQSSTSAHTSLKYDEGDMIKNPLTIANLFNEQVR